MPAPSSPVIRPRGPLAAAAVTAIVVIVVTAVRYALDPVLGESYPYILFIFPALFAADRGGWRAGTTALLVGLLVANVLFAAPRMSVRVEAPENQVGLVIYLAVGGAGVYLADGRRAAHTQAVAAGGAAAAEAAARRQTEQTLHKQQVRLLDHAYDPVLTWEPGGAITFWNAGAERLYGYAPDEAVGRASHDLLRTEFPDGRAACEAALRRAGHWEGELRHRTKDGRWVVVDSRMAVTQQDGGPPVVLEANRDVTDRRQGEEARGRLAAIVESSDDAILSKTLDGVIRTWNAGAERLFGYTADEAVGRPVTLLIPPDRLGEEEEILARLRRGDRVDHFETVRVAKGGRRLDVSLTISPLRDRRGAVVGASKIVRDVTARKQADAALRAATAAAGHALARLRAVFDAAADGLVLADGAGNLLEWNPAALRLHGYDRAEAVARSVEDFAATFELSTPDGPPLPVDEWPLPRLLRDERLADYELRVRRTDTGGEWFISYSGTALRGPDGAVELAVLTLHDVTARRRAEAALRQSEERLRLAREAGRVGIFDWDAATGRSVWTAEQEAVYGLPPGGFCGTHEDWARRVHPDDRGWVLAELDRAAADRREVNEVEYRIVRPDGEARWVVNRGRLEYTPGGRLRRLIGTTLDVTDRKRAEADLRLRDRAIGAASQGILITDPNRPDNPIIYASPGFVRLTGYAEAEVVGRNCRFLQGAGTDPHAVAAVRAAVAAGRACSVELLNYRKDGTPFWNALSVTPVHDDAGALTHFVGVQVDVTGRRQREDQYRHAQKMEAVGRLAGGIAHDFNNLLTVINGFSEVVLDGLGPAAPARDALEMVREAGERAAVLTRQLLAFSRKQVLQPTSLDLTALLAGMERLIARLIGADVAVAVRPGPGLWRVRADAGQVEQVVMNLVVNARDAMPAGGRLAVETENVTLDAGYAAAHPEARAGEFVRLAVTDTGCGMDAATRARVFEPFFTTKGERGTGLGLATVFGIVKQSGGHVEVYSEVGIGTVFKVYLPRDREPAAAGRSGVRPPPAARGRETVLLAEDEDGVRGLARLVLERAGYTVLEAPDGGAALALGGGHAGPIHLLVTDVVMPGMGGRELAGRLTTLRPGIGVLFLSGYTDDTVVRHGVLEEDVAFLQKPFSPAALAQKVREVLDR